MSGKDDRQSRDQPSLLQWLGSVTCLGLGAGLLRFGYVEASVYGGGFFPGACVVAGFALLLLSIGFLFPRFAWSLGQALWELFIMWI